MARNTLRLDTSGFEGILRKLDSLGGNVERAVDDALGKAAETIAMSTEAAVDNVNLPAGGKYSIGLTKESIIRNAQVKWDGDTAWVPVGFDFSKPGAGGFLITGTPRMKPDYELNKIYKQKRYMNLIQKGIEEIILNSIVEKMEE